MKTVQLTKGIHSSILGFGCAPVMGAVDGKRAKYALDYALEHGVNHIDLARSYGFGEAEGFVGKLIKDKRPRVVIASKFGIKPNWKTSVLKPLKPIIRLIQTSKKNSDPDAPLTTQVKESNIANYLLDRIVPLGSKNMIKGLERSLKELRTDYLDYYFIHEPFHSLSHSDELLQAAQVLKQQGKIRSWGIAYKQSQQDLHTSYMNSFDVLQFDIPREIVNYNKLVSEKGKEGNIIFSPLKGGPLKITPTEKLNSLFNDFPNSVILCSMFTPQHLEENIKVAELVEPN